MVAGQALDRWDSPESTAARLIAATTTAEGCDRALRATLAWATREREPISEPRRYGNRRGTPFWALCQNAAELLEPRLARRGSRASRGGTCTRSVDGTATALPHVRDRDTTALDAVMCSSIARRPGPGSRVRMSACRPTWLCGISRSCRHVGEGQKRDRVPAPAGPAIRADRGRGATRGDSASLGACRPSRAGGRAAG